MTNEEFDARLQQLATRAPQTRIEIGALQRDRQESGFNHADYRADVEADRRRATFTVIAGNDRQ